jgi:hypothetical protein
LHPLNEEIINIRKTRHVETGRVIDSIPGFGPPGGESQWSVAGQGDRVIPARAPSPALATGFKLSSGPPDRPSREKLHGTRAASEHGNRQACYRRSRRQTLANPYNPQSRAKTAPGC